MAYTSHLTCYFVVVILVSIIALLFTCLDAESTGELALKSNCSCPGYNLTFAECTVKGGPGDVTVWKGSAFDCSNDEIALLHSLFGSNYTQSNTVAAGECNNGSIQAHSIQVEDNCYTSQLNITVNADIIGKTIKCAHDHQSTESIIGTLTVATEDPLPPPNILFISKADFTSRQVTFNWSRAVTECPDRAIHYNILASNCGSCPTTTNDTSVTCTNVQTNGSTCTFTIQTVVCGFIAGNMSENISLTLLPFRTMMALRPTNDSLSVLITGIVLLIVTAVFVVCLLVLSKLRKKFKSTPRETCNSNQMEDNCYDLSNTIMKTFDNEKMGMYGIDDNIDCHNENPEAIPNNNIVTGHPPDLNSLLHFLQGQVTSKWYQFGLALGVPTEILNQLTDYSEEASLVELLDYWLKHHPNQPTWQEVSNAQDKIN